MRQLTLDGVVSREPKPPVFTSKGLLDFVVEMIVCEDEVSNFGLTLFLAKYTDRHFNSWKRVPSVGFLNTVDHLSMTRIS
jgi:hypothetical protein